MTISELHFDDFLSRNRVDKETWDKASIEWEVLKAIGVDFELRSDELTEIANLHARMLQRCPTVHSVRWRIKDPEHLLEKIVRKRADGVEKYVRVDMDCYLATVTDLVGLRALHLFKSDWQDIHAFLSERWELAESPIAYVREGDSEEMRSSYAGAGCRVENHPRGYRSVHYLISSQPQKAKITAEVQVRTIFEEGWSEIDHRVSYPNFSKNAAITGFLGTFNRIAGSADEMGSFVKSLAVVIQGYESQAQRAQQETESHFTKIDELIAKLDNEKQKSSDMESQLRALRVETTGLRIATASAPPLSLFPRGSVLLTPLEVSSSLFDQTKSAERAVREIEELARRVDGERANFEKALRSPVVFPKVEKEPGRESSGERRKLAEEQSRTEGPEEQGRTEGPEARAQDGTKGDDEGSH